MKSWENRNKISGVPLPKERRRGNNHLLSHFSKFQNTEPSTGPWDVGGTGGDGEAQCGPGSVSSPSSCCSIPRASEVTHAQSSLAGAGYMEGDTPAPRRLQATFTLELLVGLTVNSYQRPVVYPLSSLEWLHHGSWEFIYSPASNCWWRAIILGE